MSEQEVTSKQKLKSFLKVWGSKIAKWFVIAFTFFALAFFRLVMACLILLVGVFLCIAMLFLGSRRTGIIMVEISKTLTKYPI